MKKTILFSGLLILAFIANAQSGPAKERIESARIAYITKKVELTPDQAQQFWPIYNEFLAKRAEMRNELRQMRGNKQLKEMSEEEQTAILNKSLEIKEREAKLEKDYSKKLLKVISPAQLIALHQAEREFKELLLEKIGERRGERKGN
ncbi:Spy/CpxP family protein refolding chaperone [Mangrovivirga sp. M17]|uniref:Spy/CpxP family protein refolding chaperone n=1 Tax=Mangrovivirga halotolerans TaxID=2993936 RepID=A0ABT3RUR0_9BACT|nr:Spy/CpxP family protein refolding chaperone [Mangrovivirga halotolerans]MCX2745251.1 Spy/CpxP family protein refolding chaperone [Mangrovivirga halotolerans]